MSDDPVLSVANLRTTFNTEQEALGAVDGVTFEVPGQETLGLVGESGSGEGSSIEVDAGSVDLVAAPDDVVRAVRGSEIAMVFQDALSSLDPVYTVGNQIRELLGVHRGLSGAEAAETAANLLESVGIPDPKRRLREYPHQFSGGMQQRAVIALLLACDPSVLLCDEPTMRST